MIDRLVHHAEVLTLTGDSYRARARRALLAKDRTTDEPPARGLPRHRIDGLACVVCGFTVWVVGRVRGCRRGRCGRRSAGPG